MLRASSFLSLIDAWRIASMLHQFAMPTPQVRRPELNFQPGQRHVAHGEHRVQNDVGSQSLFKRMRLRSASLAATRKVCVSSEVRMINT